METLLSVLVGIGLSAACGFRVFVPLLIMSIASLSGNLSLAHGFSWIGTYPALIAFAIASALEITSYFIPWLDNALDTISSPAAIVAGILITASMVTDVSPFLRWTLALIAGGTVAGGVQALTVFARAASSLGSGGLANFLVAGAELAGAITVSMLALKLI